jgi:signal transduction histidine kinase
VVPYSAARAPPSWSRSPARLLEHGAKRLARALDDPTLDVAYRLGDGRYVDASGRRWSSRTETAVPSTVTAGGEEIAACFHDPALLDEPALVDYRSCDRRVWCSRTSASLRRCARSSRKSAPPEDRIVAAGDAERRRIERNLHDGAQQRLVTLSVALGLEASGRRSGDGAAPLASSRRGGAGDSELRDLARASTPRSCATKASGQRLKRSLGERRCRSPFGARSVASAGFRRAGRLLRRRRGAHQRRQARLASQASVLLERGQQDFRVVIDDDGVGGAHIEPDSGLAGLRDRLDALDATLRIESAAGGGTIVCAVLPCA